LTLVDAQFDCRDRFVHLMTLAFAAGQLVHEIIYRILIWKKGASLRTMVDLGGDFSQLSRTLQRIHDEYHTPVEIAELAQEAGMSLSGFHQRFKHMTSARPHST
jgi:AraC-like DNA-binding protein